jgi:hypothetical protein
MSQNVNLFNPAFRKQRQLLTLAAVARFLGITLAVLFGYHYYLQQQVDGLTAALQYAEGQLRSQRDHLEQLKGKTAAVPTAGAQLDADIARHENELKIAREAMEALKVGAFGSQQGFAEYLRAFSRQSVNGLWLTGFTIAGSGELEIRGRVLSPDLVPGYIQRLNKEQVLVGRSFARLEMSRPKPEAAPADKDRKAKQAPRVPRYLDFSLATTDPARPEKAP